MGLPSTLTRNKGFTLVEILITLGLIGLIVTLGLIISMEFYRDYSFRSERAIIVSALQKARSQSMDNIDETRHGVYFATPLKYIVFECDKAVSAQCSSYAGADTSKDLTIDPSYDSSVIGAPFSVVFEQLSGKSSDRTISVSDEGVSYHIMINAEGRIDWE